MAVFKKKVTQADDNRVEIMAHKNATAEAVQKAKNANQHLNELLLNNGFTLKIYLAAGGKIKQKGHSS